MNERKPIPMLDLSREIERVSDKISQRVNNVMFNKTDFIIGKDVDIFENNFAKFIGTDHCIGVANGTDAIEMAIAALDLNDDDEVITQANTYVATCFGITNNKKRMKMVDINKSTYQMDLDDLEKSITEKTKVVVIVHLTGSCCDMDRLMKIINKHNLILIEDASQSHGAMFNNKNLGTFGLMSTFSFYPGKNLGAFGDAGAICTNNKAFDLKLRKMRNNGSIEKYVHEIYGRNSRLDTIQAAILDVKLTNLAENNKQRRKHAEQYKELLKDVSDIHLPVIEPLCVPVYHLFVIRTKKRDELKKFLEDNKIYTGIHYPISISKLKCYEGYFDKSFEKSEQNSHEILSLPMFPDLTEDEIKTVCNTIIKFFK